jgi:hypothetical protein
MNSVQGWDEQPNTAAPIEAQSWAAWRVLQIQRSTLLTDIAPGSNAGMRGEAHPKMSSQKD